MIQLNINKVLDTTDGVMNLELDIAIEKGAFVTLYGDSGVGKTSTLRMLSGLLNPDGGSIVINEETWFNSDEKINRNSQFRNIGYVFQDYALFPNMTVRQNLEFASSKNKSSKRIEEIIEILELRKLQNKKPETLSGGQKQRVALGRALAQSPKILLLDEPLSALDIKARLKLQDYLLKVHKEFNLTTILISHDIGEILKLSDYVYVLSSGKVIKEGNPQEVFVANNISGKFKFVGEILKISPQDVVYVVTVLIQTNVVKIIAQESEIKEMNIGDKVMVASKAFNPVIFKIN